MGAAEQRIADLEQQVAELAFEVRNLQAEAFVIRPLAEMLAEHAGYSTGQPVTAKTPRPRHLAPVQGGQR